MKGLLALENIAIRIMYFLNVTDTFLPFSIISYLLLTRLPSAWHGEFLVQQPLTLTTLAIGALLYIFCCIAEFHLFFLPIVLPVMAVAALHVPSFWAQTGLSVCALFGFTSIVQIVFMGAPMAAASRKPNVALSMWMRSFIIFAPTTISLPITMGYQLFVLSGMSLAQHAPGPILAGTILLCGLCAVAVRLVLGRSNRTPTHHPASAPGQPQYQRVILLNLDGVSWSAFCKSDARFLKRLATEFAFAPDGAQTVYKAFTNPAFASILSGHPPRRHGVINNNLGQQIRTEALPDLVPSRLYGSMHVKHFSRSSWQTSIVSLVQHRYDHADTILIEQVKKDLKQFGQVRLWVVDLSLPDYCGHAWGSYAKPYIHAIEETDRLIEQFMGWCSHEKLLEDTLFVISSDHGLFIGEHAYALHPEEKFVPLIFAGKTVAQGGIAGPVSIMDIAANISFCLGIHYCAGSSGSVFPEVASGTKSTEMSARMLLTSGF